MGRRLIITGALGHIGSRLIRSPAIASFDEVVLLDNLLTQRYAALFDLPARPRYHFVEADILTADLSALFAGTHAVVHLAAITDATGSLRDPAQTEAVNFTGTERIARAAAQSGARLLFISTTSVYGTQDALVDEATPIDALHPQSPYAASKIKAEILLRELAATSALRYTICRFGTIYGTSPGMRFHTAVNKFCWQAVLDQPVTVWRTALDQVRPYLDLSDACAAIGFLLARDLFSGDLFNILTDNRTVREITNIIAAHRPLQIKLVDSPIMNQLSYHVSNAKLRDLGFAYAGNMEKGISSTIQLLHNMNGRG